MIGARLGPYRLTAALGFGGMGAVYRATVETAAGALPAGTEVAVKVVHGHLLGQSELLERFAREADIGRRVVHANVVRTLDAGEVRSGGAEIRFLVMEYVEGQTLRALGNDLGCVPEELCRHVGREVAKGLAAIHAAGAVHRDLKPENVMIARCAPAGRQDVAGSSTAGSSGRDGHGPSEDSYVVKVMDLGVARLEGEEMRLSQAGAFVGSLRYAAPEQLESAGRNVDGRADLYALGLLLYELSTATHPFVADDVPAVIDRVLHVTPRRAGEIHPQLSPLFEELLAQLLEKDRDLRPASAQDVVRILEAGEESAWWKQRAISIRRTSRRPPRRIRIPRETAVHGREQELATLRALYERAASGKGAVVLLDGEAGIGKSRLLDEFVAALERRGEETHCLVGGYPPGGAATSSGAFSTAYREHFGEEGSTKWLGSTPVLVPAFDALLRGEPAPAGAEPLRKDSLQTCFVHATRALSKDRTTIVLIDDLHFAPQEGRELFAALALAVSGHRVLLVGTTRPGLDERWIGEIDRIGAARLSLPRLGAPDLVRLLADSLHSQHLAEELAGKIAVKSDGNPFFVFEILRGLREGQFLTKRPDGTWVTTQVIRDIQIPSSIRELVEARVSDLDDASRNLLDVAACVGREFDARVAASVLGIGPIPSLQTLGKIERRHRLVRAVGGRFVFDHHQVQETLYDALSKPLREAYHAAIAETVEAQTGAAAREPKDLCGALCVDLAGHFLRGEQGPRAMRYLDAAITHLERNYLNDDAVRLADRALSVPGLVVGRARAETLLRKAARLDLLGRREAERAALDEALALADADGDAALRAQARRALGTHLAGVSKCDEAMTRLQEAADLARVAGDRGIEAAVTGRLGNVLSDLGRFAEARAHHERHLAMAREIGSRSEEAVAAGGLGSDLRALGRLAEAREQLARHLALAREVGDRRGEAVATGNLGMVLDLLGRFDEAREHYERMLAIAREIGDRRGEAIATGNLGGCFYSLGRFAQACTQVERTLELAREIGARQGEAIAAGNIAFNLRMLGRLADAREANERALSLARAAGDRRVEGYWLDGRGHVAAEEGRAADAEAAWLAAIALRDEIGYAMGAADSRAALGAFLGRAGRTLEARALLEAALATAREAAMPGTETVCLALLATLPGGDAAAAEAALAQHGPRLGFVEMLNVRLALFQATGARGHLAEASRLVDAALAAAPEEHRAPMLANVCLFREIVAAAHAAGLAP